MSDPGSLFGSPPPSPEGPRTVALALPGAENVGTIALPGSPIRSEHSNDLPASRLRTRTDIIFDNDRSDGQSTCRAGPSRRRTARVHAENAFRDSASPRPERPPPPPLVLPEPGEAPPPDLLRSQAALLGHAGLIAGVRPADLPREGHGDGASAARPIVVPEEVAPPTALPMPKSSTILTALSRSTNLALVLSSLQRTLNESSRSRQSTLRGVRRSRRDMEDEDEEMNTQQRPAKERDPLAAPPVKRRKLRRVPAGAVDWDVPYPFKDGEGPETYELMWQRDRLRSLVAQLVGLLKSATRSAAAREYLLRIGADAQGRDIALQEARRIGRKPGPASSEGAQRQDGDASSSNADPLADQSVVEQILAGLYSMPPSSSTSSSQSPQTATNPMDDLFALFDSTTASQPSTSSPDVSTDLNALFDGVNFDALLPASGEFDLSFLDMPLGDDFSGAIPEPSNWDWSVIDPSLQPIPPSTSEPAQLAASSTQQAPSQSAPFSTQPRPRNTSASSTPQLALSPSVSAYSFGPPTPHTAWDMFSDTNLGLDQPGLGGIVQLDTGKGRQQESSVAQDEDAMDVDLPDLSQQDQHTTAGVHDISPAFQDRLSEGQSAGAPVPPISASSASIPPSRPHSLAPSDPLLTLAATRLKDDDVIAAQLAAVSAAQQERDAEFLRQTEERNAQKRAEKRGTSVFSTSTRYPSVTPTHVPSGPATRRGSTATPSRGSSTAPSIATPDKGKGKAPAPAPPIVPATGKKATERSEARAALIERARARKAAIEAELPRANLALWETMIEHTVLAHMIKEATGSVPEDPAAVADSQKKGKAKGKGRAR
ncbi:unnamed protein product [Peniophora sp. CBMAI 1063]|nr:unnamed protein product [Peniophora sp. CBMAI 1063]